MSKNSGPYLTLGDSAIDPSGSMRLVTALRYGSGGHISAKSLPWDFNSTAPEELLPGLVQFDGDARWDRWYPINDLRPTND